MSFVDKLIPVYAQFGIGYGVISLFMAITNFGMIILLYLTNVLKLDTPPYALIILAGAAAVTCVSIGLFLIKYDIQSRTASYLNMQANPEIKQIAEDVRWLRKQMEARDK